MSGTVQLLTSRISVRHGCLLSARRSPALRWLSSGHRMSRGLKESYRLLQLPEEGSSTPAQVEEAYRAVLTHQSKIGHKEAEEEEEDEGKSRGAALQHRHYLSFDGVGSGTPSQRERQYRQVRVGRAGSELPAEGAREGSGGRRRAGGAGHPAAQPQDQDHPGGGASGGGPDPGVHGPRRLQEPERRRETPQSLSLSRVFPGDQRSRKSSVFTFRSLEAVLGPCSCCRVAEDDGPLPASLPVEGLCHDPARRRHGGPVVCDVLVVRVLGALQLPGADVAEHDAEGAEAEHAHHQDNVHDALRLGPDSAPGLHGMLGGVVLSVEVGAVEAVVQEGEQERLQLRAVGGEHDDP
uniref:DnaJ (Hsp40) homolog, subfamily C, member 28 n=1 Tax=Oryzias latipes TaxID=8090 RepID=A0A3P9M412_ORYLA